MDWKRLISELMEAGVTQTKLAELCGTSQSTISDLRRGASESPSWMLGDRLLELHRKTVAAPVTQAAPIPTPTQEPSHAG